MRSHLSVPRLSPKKGLKYADTSLRAPVGAKKGFKNIVFCFARPRWCPNKGLKTVVHLSGPRWCPKKGWKNADASFRAPVGPNKGLKNVVFCFTGPPWCSKKGIFQSPGGAPKRA